MTMTIREFFAETVGGEKPAFIRVIEALPKDKLDYRSDPKAKTALELASLFAGEAMMLIELLKGGLVDATKGEPMPKFATTEEISAAMGKAMDELKAMAEGMSEDDWIKEGKMIFDPTKPWVEPRGLMAFHILFDMIHHRGQLSTYIRPMGGKNPSIYGPSADTQG